MIRICFSALVFTVSIGFCLSQTFEDRRAQYIDSSLANPNSNSMTIEAYEGLTVNQAELNSYYAVMQTQSTIDFKIVQLIRVMMLGGGLYDSQMIPELNSVPYWVNYSDTLRGYWSENHMIMWMSSDWIMHEYTGRPVDPHLENRLEHYLQMKINHGFYEFFSSTYAPYCLTGLLNLADFAQDQEIQALATAAAKRLLSELLLPTNELGVFFPAAGRNYSNKYENPYGHNHSHLIWLLTGMGEIPSNSSHAGGFLATSTIDISEVTGWTSELDTVVSIGHTLEEGQVLNQDQFQVDRIMFQWSSGGYFHPLVVTESVQFIVDSNLWNHVDFELLAPLAGQPVESYQAVSEALDEMSMSSVISGQDVAIFKNGRVVLTSIQDFWKGKVGYQQWPVCANVGATAVYTNSGEVPNSWNEVNSSNANNHLPYVEQSHNVALVMYRPQEVSGILPFDDKSVTLHWPDTAFDEVIEDGAWLIGRQADGYVAARRSCTEEVNGHPSCPTEGGQTWVLVVGNEDMYGSFSDFQNSLIQSQFTESWNVNMNGDSVYYASIAMDSIWIEHYWDPFVNTGISEYAANRHSLKLWPNPTTELITIELGEYVEGTLVCRNSLGQLIYSQPFGPRTSRLEIQVSTWPRGLYAIEVNDGEGRSVGRMIKH